MRRYQKKMLSFLAVSVFVLSLGSITRIQPIEANPRTVIVPDNYPTIQEAINNATDGDTIQVANGTYCENLIINKALKILGENKSTTVIQANDTDADVVQIIANGVYISGFTIRTGGHGVRLSESSNCTITGNIIFNNSFGVGAYKSSDNTISNNLIINNTRNSTQMATGCGIFLNEKSTKNTLIGNTVTHSGEGIYVLNSNNNTVARNFLLNNSKTGVCLMKGADSADYNRIYDNVIMGGACFGIDLWSVKHNVIFNNTLKNNGEGFEIDTSNNNTFYQNNLIHHWKGMYIQGSNNNTFYRNNIVDNYIQITSHSSTNVWDNGFEGNYWSDYAGVDLHSGPYQNETGSDDIGDTPYIIPIGSQDRYPLMKSCPWTPWSPHDIGIANLAISKSIIGQGRTASGRIIVFNYGNNTENFNATIYANTTIIAAFTNIVLASRNFTVIFFNWNTTGWAKGNYKISAELTQVPGETDTVDNTRSAGMVRVTVPGDYNGDGTVDDGDVTLVRVAWQSRRGQSNYNQNADFNVDGIIDIKDASIIGVNWQKHA